MLEDTFSSASVESHSLKFREEPLSEAKIIHYHLCLEPKRKFSRRKRSQSKEETDHTGIEELFLVLTFHLLKDYFRKDRWDSAKRAVSGKGKGTRKRAQRATLADTLLHFINRTRERNAYLLELSGVLRSHLIALDIFHRLLSTPREAST